PAAAHTSYGQTDSLCPRSLRGSEAEEGLCLWLYLWMWSPAPAHFALAGWLSFDPAWSCLSAAQKPAQRAPRLRAMLRLHDFSFQLPPNGGAFGSTPARLTGVLRDF